jgi:hypothetical protein
MTVIRLLAQICALFLLLPSTLLGQVKSPPGSESEYAQRFQENQAKERINGVYIPKTLDDALAQLDKMIDPKAKNSLKIVDENTAATKLHFSLGRWMIVNWSFYEGSRFSNYLHSAGITFPDDQADFMIRAYHRHVNGKSVEFKELATSYRAMRKEKHQKDLEGAKVIEEVRKPRKQ